VGLAEATFVADERFEPVAVRVRVFIGTAGLAATVFPGVAALGSASLAAGGGLLALVDLALPALAVVLVGAGLALAGLAAFGPALALVAAVCPVGGVVDAPAAWPRASRMASGSTLNTFGIALTNNEFFEY
jgi:hypothetical protein